MRHRVINETPKTYALIFETGDELAEGLKNFATQQNLGAASFKAQREQLDFTVGFPGNGVAKGCRQFRFPGADVAGENEQGRPS